MSVIKDGETVLMRKGAVTKLVQVRFGRKLFLEKAKFCIDGIIGHTYGSTFEVVNGQLVKIDNVDFQQDIGVDTESGVDNRNLKDDGVSQKLTKEDILELKKEFTGSEIVSQLVENSATFSGKTEFSQQKYLKKKHKKFRAVFVVLRPTARLMAEMYYNQGPSRICNLRVDSLAQILERSSVRSGSRLLVCESCLGIITGALLERMGGRGLLIDFNITGTPSRPALFNMNLPAEEQAIVHSFPMEYMSTVDSDTPLTAAANGAGGDSKDTGDTAGDTGDNDMPGEEEVKVQEEEEDPEAAGCADNGSEVSMDVASDPTTGGQSKRAVSSADKEQEKKDRNSRRQARRQQLENTRQLLRQRNFDGLVVACKLHPTDVVLSLVDYLLPSRPIVVFSAYKEPLVDCYRALRDRKGIIMLTLSECWLREYQVLANRTHPVVNMSGGGGYLLTGINVEK